MRFKLTSFENFAKNIVKSKIKDLNRVAKIFLEDPEISKSYGLIYKNDTSFSPHEYVHVGYNRQYFLYPFEIVFHAKLEARKEAVESVISVIKRTLTENGLVGTDREIQMDDEDEVQFDFYHIPSRVNSHYHYEPSDYLRFNSVDGFLRAIKALSDSGYLPAELSGMSLKDIESEFQLWIKNFLAQKDGEKLFAIISDSSHSIDADLVKSLIDAGADMNVKVDDKFLWMAAINQSSIEIVKLVLQSNTVPLPVALHYATVCGKTEVVELLVTEMKVDPNVKHKASGLTPLMMAIKKGHSETAKLLLDTKGVEVNAHDNDGNTPLTLAAAKDENVSLVTTLLQRNANPNHVVISTGKTALQIATENGCQKIMRCLQECERTVKRADEKQADEKQIDEKRPVKCDEKHTLTKGIQQGVWGKSGSSSDLPPVLTREESHSVLISMDEDGSLSL